MTNCACHTEMQGWSFESFWREEKGACGKPGCGRTAAGAQAREERSPPARPATAGLASTVNGMALTTAAAAADRVAVGLTLATLSFGALSVLAAMLHYAI